MDEPRRARLDRPLRWLTVVVIASLAAACGGSTVNPTPTVPPVTAATPVPSPTPERHIAGTLQTNEVFQLLVAARIRVYQESIGNAGPDGEPEVVLHVVSGPTHVAIRQYSTAAAVLAAGFKPGSAVAVGDAPFELWASNIVLDIGPVDLKAKPTAADPVVASTALSIADALDPFIGPFQQRSVDLLTLPSTPAPPTPAAHPSPSPSPARSS